MAIGDLLRAEITNNTVLGNEIKTLLESGEALGESLINELLLNRFFNDSMRKILVNYPRSKVQAESLAEKLKNSSSKLNAVVVVDLDKESIAAKFTSQVYCKDPHHPKLETSKVNPVCKVCGEAMFQSYDLGNEKVAYLIDKYYEQNGALSAAWELSQVLGVAYISYTTPSKVVERVQGE